VPLSLVSIELFLGAGFIILESPQTPRPVPPRTLSTTAWLAKELLEARASHDRGRPKHRCTPAGQTYHVCCISRICMCAMVKLCTCRIYQPKAREHGVVYDWWRSRIGIAIAIMSGRDKRLVFRSCCLEFSRYLLCCPSQGLSGKGTIQHILKNAVHVIKWKFFIFSDIVFIFLF